MKTLLGDSVRGPDFVGVVERFKSVPGFEACAIIHREGDLLATSWKGRAGDMLEVIAPQVLKRVSSYMEHLEEGPMTSVTVSVGERLLTFAQGGDLCVVGVHEPGTISAPSIECVHRVAEELGRRVAAKTRK